MQAKLCTLMPCLYLGLWIVALGAALCLISATSAADNAALNRELTDWLLSNGGAVRWQTCQMLEM